jgi:thiol-disulfide isomerase/thioredoxin
MPRRWTCAALAGAMIIADAGCQKQPGAQEGPTGDANSSAATIDAEMKAKIAEAKANYDKLSPAEKKKMEAEFAKVRNTMPLSLQEAGGFSVHRQGQAPGILASMAPKGTPAIIAAWASWCIPCKLEARELARLRTQYRPDQLSIAYLNIGDPKVEAEKGARFLRDTGADALGLTMIDPKAFLKLTRVEQLSVPRILVYDREGKPTEVIAGGMASGPDPRIAAAARKVVGM